MQFDQLKRRRELIMMLGGMAASSVACPFPVHAQRGERMRHVGLREGHTANDPVVKMKIFQLIELHSAPLLTRDGRISNWR
jgi:hypothetical protein